MPLTMSVPVLGAHHAPTGAIPLPVLVSATRWTRHVPTELRWCRGRVLLTGIWYSAVPITSPALNFRGGLDPQMRPPPLRRTSYALQHFCNNVGYFESRPARTSGMFHEFAKFLAKFAQDF